MLRSPLLILLLLAVLAVAIILLATKFGIGVTPDSTVYLDAARRLLDGNGLTALSSSGEFKPLTHYPPLYSCSLALAGFMVGSIETAARWFNAVLFGATVFVSGLTLRRYAPSSLWLPILGSVFTLTANDIVSIHTFALSEPLFLFFVLNALLCLSIHLERTDGTSLFCSAGLTALALMTRYAGVALVLCGAVVLLLLSQRGLRRRLIEVIEFGAISCVPAAIWSLRNKLVGGGATDRPLMFHPLELRQLGSALQTFASWLLLGKIHLDYRIVLFGVEVILLTGLVVYLIRRRRTLAPDHLYQKNRIDKLPHVLSIFTGCYLGLLIFTASFVDADTVFDARALVPLHLVAIALVLCLSYKLLGPLTSSGSYRTATVCFAIIFVTSYSVRAAKWFVLTRQDGQIYRSNAWQQSAAISSVKRLPPGTVIYSNGYDAIYYLTGQPAIYVPEKIVHGTGRQNLSYEDEVSRMRERFETGGAVLVYFHTLPERWFLPSEKELVGELKVRPIAQTSDGVLYSRSKEAFMK